MQGKKMAMNTAGFILLSHWIPTGVHDTFLLTHKINKIIIINIIVFVIWVTALKYKESL